MELCVNDKLDDRNKNDLCEEKETKVHHEQGDHTEVNDKEKYELAEN